MIFIQLKINSMIKSIVSEFGQLGCYEGEYEDKDFTYYSLSNNGATIHLNC
ncbi:Uncharacterised protein [Sphingobacterium daejeonense]|nr:Uncharacterised protein [Sphingobacterium daejeonense]